MIAAQHIKSLRLEHNFTQSYLAHELEISQKTYSNMESGKSKITLTHLGKLSALYNKSVSDFIQLINVSDNKTVKMIEKAHPNISSAALYDGINNNLPFELINQLKARIEDLNALVRVKDNRIEDLKEKIMVLQKDLSH